MAGDRAQIRYDPGGIDLFRAGRTCQLLITKHEQGSIEKGGRPSLKNSLVFRGMDGFLDVELWGKDRELAGSETPQFWSRGGEVVEIPEAFRPAVRATTHGASCVGCSHSHYLRNPSVNVGLLIPKDEISRASCSPLSPKTSPFRTT